MTEARLPAALEASAIRRLVEVNGGNAMVLRKGDPDRGSLILVFAQRGVHHAILERVLEPSGCYRWTRVARAAATPGEVTDFLNKRHRIDPDSWLIELDVPDAERFIADMSSVG